MKSCTKCLGALTAVVFLAAPALAEQACMTGMVKSVNAEKKTFVMTSNSTEHTLKLDDHVTINRDGKESKGELKVGDHVSVCYDKGVVNNTAKYILVQDGDFKNCVVVRVTIKNYDASAKKITFTDMSDNKTWTFGLDSAKVRLDGQDSKIQNIKIGDPALVIVDRTLGVNNATLKAVLAWSK
jgi:hypothetical protein